MALLYTALICVIRQALWTSALGPQISPDPSLQTERGFRLPDFLVRGHCLALIRAGEAYIPVQQPAECGLARNAIDLSSNRGRVVFRGLVLLDE